MLLDIFPAAFVIGCILYDVFAHRSQSVNGNSDVLRYVYVSILVYFLDIRGSIGGFTEGIVEM